MIEDIDDINDVIAKINSGGDRTSLVGVSKNLLNFEKESPDVYNFGITEIAFDFVIPLFIQIPPVMEDVELRECDDPPAHLAEFAVGGTVFEFFKVDYRSTGGQIIFHQYANGFRVENAERIETIVGYVAAEDLVIRRRELVSGNRLR